MHPPVLHSKLVRTCRQHAGGVYCIGTDAFEGSGGSRVWSGSNDFTCNMWTSNGKFVKQYAGHTNGVRCIRGQCNPMARAVAI